MSGRKFVLLICKCVFRFANDNMKLDIYFRNKIFILDIYRFHTHMSLQLSMRSEIFPTFRIWIRLVF